MLWLLFSGLQFEAKVVIPVPMIAASSLRVAKGAASGWLREQPQARVDGRTQVTLPTLHRWSHTELCLNQEVLSLLDLSVPSTGSAKVS